MCTVLEYLSLGVCPHLCSFVSQPLETQTTTKGPGKRGHIAADTLLPTQMFPRLPACATFVGDTNFVFSTNVSQFAQHGNTTFILCPARLRAQETS